MSNRFIITAVIAMGCTGKPGDTAGTAEETGDQAPLDEAECAEAGGEAAYGWPLEQQDGGYCYSEAIYEEERQYAGCNFMASAAAVEMIAGPPGTEECWLFSNPVIPEGWIECEGITMSDCSS